MKRLVIALSVAGPLALCLGLSCPASAQAQEKTANVDMQSRDDHSDAKNIRSNRRRAKREKKNLAHLRLESNSQTAHVNPPADAAKAVRPTLNAKMLERAHITGGL